VSAGQTEQNAILLQELQIYREIKAMNEWQIYKGKEGKLTGLADLQHCPCLFPTVLHCCFLLSLSPENCVLLAHVIGMQKAVHNSTTLPMPATAV
jgi:predicted transporter